ncbi:UDP-N-acetylglucosamine 2-epimerase [Kurthia huakuii]|uniref:UDP-N-acetylglucosamine 2-epimerase n=1 Tax=Kurthia huakuii TaxID=1421019 RepID=UPI0004955F21|nr:UDP-N-acetylglucosamine 2-epimerase [Kurthia huakuii]MBM7700747.1 UDP-N-acetylglucosamine 2-epimerase (non-hydrolyzing)/GDP/UDP-N,N'-diacetylbacillosamine 2-epimerase (hydrolyzing) [Kurthia huakuii]
MKRKICVVTGTRAEYGALKLLINTINSDPDLELQIIATGAHLSPEYGLTYQEIEKDGFHINEKIETLLSSDTTVGIAKTIGLTTISFSETFNRLKPDCILIMGDRYEMLAVAQVALIMQIPLVHISGGEITEGAIDDSIRHALTKLSTIHFPANEIYRKRIIQLGEHPNNVFNFGDPSVENIYRLDFIKKNQLEDFFNWDLENFFLITFHPVTQEPRLAEQQIKELFKALDNFKNYKFIFTKSNADSEGRIINELIDEYVEDNRENAKAYFSLGYEKYLSTMKYASAVIGNSSSGIIEAPILKVPTLDIGNRQKGRLKAKSIVECKCSERNIVESLNKILQPEFNRSLKDMELYYQGENTSNKMVEVLKEIDFESKKTKLFYDIKF